MPIENIQELYQLVLGTLLFAHSLHAGLQGKSGQSGQTKEPLAGPEAFKRSGRFL